jgi:hypothetical protein
MGPFETGQPNAQEAFRLVLEGRRYQQAFCDHLELLADQLGQRLDHQLARTCRGYLARDLIVHQMDEEAVFELLKRQQASLPISRLINLAVAEHERHRDYAIEVSEGLDELSQGGPHPNPEALGYLLRATFESMRQHLEWEEATLFQDARHAMAAAPNHDLAKHLSRNRQVRPLDV